MSVKVKNGESKLKDESDDYDDSDTDGDAIGDSDVKEEVGESGVSENDSEVGSGESNDEGESVKEHSKDSGSDVENNSDSGVLSAENNKIKENPGWADAMAKILKTNKPKRKKTIVLAKAKKFKPETNDLNEDVKTFEVEGEIEEKPKLKLETGLLDKPLGKKIAAQLEMAKRIRKKSLEAKGRTKPSVLDKDREKLLAKVATKGVVQLFNAVRQQQKSLEKEIQKVGSSNIKKDKVLKSVDKRAFLDVLMGAKSQCVPDSKSQTTPQIKDESKSTSEWSVLRDDFMMGTKLKDWDKDEDEVKEEFD